MQKKKNETREYQIDCDSYQRSNQLQNVFGEIVIYFLILQLKILIVSAGTLTSRHELC